MRPGAVQESRQRQQVRIALRLRGALAAVDHITQVDVFAVGREDVGQGARHGARAELVGLPARLGVGAVDGRGGERPAGAGLQADQVDAAVQVRRPPGRGDHRAVRHQHAAGDGRGRLDLPEGRDEPLLACRPPAPGQGAVVGADAVDAAVAAAEEGPAVCERGRRIDAAARREGPRGPAGGGIEGRHAVIVDRGDEHLAARHRGRGQRAADVGRPEGLQRGRDGRRRGAAALGVVAVGGPGVTFDFGFWICDGCIRRALLERVNRRPAAAVGRGLPFRRVRGEGVEARQLGRNVASAGVRRGVQQAVGRHHAVPADAADPTVPEHIAAGEVDELDAAPPAQDVPVGGLVPPAPMMVAGVLGFDLLEHLAGGQVALRGEVGSPGGPAFARRPSLERLEAALPERPARHEHVANLAERCRLRPEGLARRHRQGRHGLAVGADGLVVGHQPELGGGRRPLLAAGREVQADDLVAPLVEHAVAGGAQRARPQAGGLGARLLPEDAAGGGVEGHDGRGGLGVGAAELLDDRVGRFADVHGRLVLPHQSLPLFELGNAFAGDAADGEQEDPLVPQDLLRALGLLVHLDGLAGGGVDGAQGRVETQGDVEAVAGGHEPPLKMLGRASPVHDMRIPWIKRPLPERQAVVRVAGDEVPLGQPPEGDRGPLVGDVEEASARRDHGVDGGGVLVAAGVARVGQPLDTAGRADRVVVGHGVAARVVEVVGPFVGVTGLWLDGLLPPAALSDVERAAGGQDAHRVVGRDAAQVLGHDEVGQVVDERQAAAVEA